MPNWDIFRWLRTPSRDIHITILREKFSKPDASVDRCQEPGCGIIRAEHSFDAQGHHFKEE